MAEQWSLEFKRQVFLIFKEALHNVRRHAAATHVEIGLAMRGEVFEMQIRDDGCGFDVGAGTVGHGLASMRQRAETLGGMLNVESVAGAGTKLVLSVKVTSQWRKATA